MYDLPMKRLPGRPKSGMIQTFAPAAASLPGNPGTVAGLPPCPRSSSVNRSTSVLSSLAGHKVVPTACETDPNYPSTWNFSVFSFSQCFSDSTLGGVGDYPADHNLACFFLLGLKKYARITLIIFSLIFAM
jgi:hypothetical protein